LEIPLKIGACAAAVLALSLGAAGASPGCGGAGPSELSFQRVPGAAEGTLSWRDPSAPGPGTYRVYRDGRLVGETAGRSLGVKVSPGHRYVFSVRAVDASGHASSCVVRLEQEVRSYAPSRISGVALTGVSGRHARLVWSRAKPGDGRIARYRVYRNGRPFASTRALSLRVSATRARSFRVAATDTRGHVGPQSRPVKVVKGHHPPGRPAGLRATRVDDSGIALSWSASARRSGRIAGYRIYRNGALVRQVRGRTGSDASLAPGTHYRFTVAAIDTQGYMSAFTAPLSVSTAMPAPTKGRAHAFLLASTDESFHDLQRHYRQIGTVYPTYFDCAGPDGAMKGRDDALVTRWAQLRRIEVQPRFNCQEAATLHSILSGPGVRAGVIARLVGLVREHGYDGINVDFENGVATDRDALTAFVSDLAARLHAIGKRVSVEVSPKFEHTTTGRSGFYDYAALSRAADRVFVMNWGWHWETSTPGAPDDMELSRKVADYVASMPNKARFVLGTHLYGLDWPNGGGPSNGATPLEYTDVRALIARYGAAPVLDPAADAWVFTYTDDAGVPHEVWYADAATIARRVRLARERGLGIGFWRLGNEDQRIWDDEQIAAGSSWP
jgi:spore germination protein YaaH